MVLEIVVTTVVTSGFQAQCSKDLEDGLLDGIGYFNGPDLHVADPFLGMNEVGLATVQDLVGDGRSRLFMVRSGDADWQHRNRSSGIL